MILFAEFDSFPSNIESKIENPLEYIKLNKIQIKTHF